MTSKSTGSFSLVDELPLVVGGALRSPFDLVTITAESKGRGNQLSLGGGQAAAWDATLDGISATTNRSARNKPVRLSFFGGGQTRLIYCETRSANQPARD